MDRPIIFKNYEPSAGSRLVHGVVLLVIGWGPPVGIWAYERSHSLDYLWDILGGLYLLFTLVLTVIALWQVAKALQRL
jgi:hypothetical protein